MTDLPTLLAPYLGQTLTPELVQQITDLTTLTTADVPEPIAGDWVAAPGVRPSPWRLVLDEHQRVAEWVAAQTDCSAHAWAGYVCVGLEKSGALVAGVVLESYNGRNANIHVAGVGKHWLSRNLLTTIFHYAFNHLKLKRLTGLVPASNVAALDFDRHIGFELEYVMPDGAKDGDLCILVMRPEQCRYLPNEVTHHGR